MGLKVDAKMAARIIELHLKHGCTQAIVAQRLGISSRTVRLYLKAYKDSLAEQPSTISEEENVPSNDNRETSK